MSMKKSDLVDVAVVAGLYPNKTAARAVPVAELREVIAAHLQRKEDEEGALTEATWQVQHTEPFQALAEASQSEDAYEADVRAHTDAWVASIEADHERAERRVPPELRTRLRELRRMPVRNRAERRRVDALLRRAMRDLYKLGLTPAELRMVA